MYVTTVVWNTFNLWQSAVAKIHCLLVFKQITNENITIHGGLKWS
jgi:hypothetical protein